MNEKDFLGKSFLLADGSFLSILGNVKYLRDYPFDFENIFNPHVVREVHVKFLEAGVNVLRTNTFNSNPLRLREFNEENLFEKIILRGIEISKEVSREYGEVFIAGRIGSLGKNIDIYRREVLKDSFRYQIETFLRGGVDFFIFETITSIYEGEIILEVLKEFSYFPVIFSFTYPLEGETLLLCGSSPMDVVRIFGGDVDVLGVNCINDISKMDFILESYEMGGDYSFAAFPNGGIPDVKDGSIKYHLDNKDFLNFSKKWIEREIVIIGGCCGVSPEHIKEVNKSFSKY